MTKRAAVAPGAPDVGPAGATPAAPGLYDDPHVYDVLFTPGTAAEVTGLERAAVRLGALRARATAGASGARAPLWLEPACGSGRYLRVLAARGYRVVGFDREPAMVEYTRATLARRGQDRHATLFAADMTRFADRVGVGVVDVAFNLLNTIRHLDTDRALQAHFREMARVLKPRGVYAIGLSLTPYGIDAPSEDVWRATRGGLHVEQVVQYVPPADREAGRAEGIYSHLTLERAGHAETRSSHYTLRTYDEAEWAAALRRSPFTAVDCVNERGRSIGPLVWPYGIQVLRRK